MIERARIGREPPHRLALALAALPFALHLAALSKYDFFRDELYFIVCGRHPAFGYVDQPPLIPLLAAASQSAGESLWLLRIIPALFHVGAVLAACAIARLIGGGRGAQIVTGIATGTAPLLLAITATLTTTAIEPLAWTLVAYAALRAVLRTEPRWWIVAGLAAGIALEAKYTIAFFLAGLVVGIAASGPRAVFRAPAFWLGCGVTLVLGAPSLIWQALHGWPFAELLAAGAAGKNVVLSPLPWLLETLVTFNPLFAPLWIAGIVALIASARTRFAGIAVVLLFLTFVGLHAKVYYLVGLFPLLFAAGGVALERALPAPLPRGAYTVLALTLALVLAPLGIPLLPEPQAIAYAARIASVLHFRPAPSEHHEAALLTQTFADMHGWRELADRVAAAQRMLSPDERATAAVYTQNYGEAAAVDVYGRGTMPVISGHNAYWTWGPQGEHRAIIIVGGRRADHERVFRDVRQVETVRTPYAMPYENNLPVYIARDPKIDLRQIWPQLRHYD